VAGSGRKEARRQKASKQPHNQLDLWPAGSGAYLIIACTRLSRHLHVGVLFADEDKHVVCMSAGFIRRLGSQQEHHAPILEAIRQISQLLRGWILRPQKSWLFRGGGGMDVDGVILVSRPVGSVGILRALEAALLLQL
jgi:hypothetical protein